MEKGVERLWKVVEVEGVKVGTEVQPVVHSLPATQRSLWECVKRSRVRDRRDVRGTGV